MLLMYITVVNDTLIMGFRNDPSSNQLKKGNIIDVKADDWVQYSSPCAIPL